MNLGSEVRELKLGSSFNVTDPKPLTSFHTLKYDFKPASVDLSKVATLDVGSNNQVTVTVPHLATSGVRKTIFKGNRRAYTKECVLIYDKTTGLCTIEKADANIQVKKTRIENPNKPILPQAQMLPIRASLENSTQRTVSKTKVSTGVRKNAIGGFVQRHSPIQGSPSYQHHKSPQQAPAWNANNTQSTLPSIPLIGMDDDIIPTTAPIPPQAISEQSTYVPSQQLHYQQANHYQQPQNHPIHSSAMNNYPPNIIMNSSSSSTSNNNHNYHHNSHQQLPLLQPNAHEHENEVGVLSSSDSSSDSDSSGSGSDSDDNDRPPIKTQANNNMNIVSLPADLLDEDLRLSESNSSDSDD